MSIERVRLDRRIAEAVDESSDDVGYRKPPKAHQFKRGRSGNPNGRPKGTRNFATDVKAMLKAPIKVAREGKAKKISTQEASLMRLREKALTGDARALDRLLALAQAYNNEELVAKTATMSADDAMLFDILAERVRSGAISATPGTKDGGHDPNSEGDSNSPTIEDANE